MTAPVREQPQASPIAGLFPGYFALVMATGIVAVGAAQQQLVGLAEVLYAIAGGAYVVLLALLAVRLLVYPRRVVDDLTSHLKGFAFLTVVAGTNVLGSASIVVHGWWGLGRGLWWCGLGLWALLVYAALIPAVLKGPKPGLGEGINGTWFLLTVATESIAVLGALLLGRDGGDLLAFTCLAAFLLGIVLYLIVMTMVFLRWTFHELSPTEADPPAWIAAGAVAITVLAGSNLLLARTASARVDRLGSVVEAFVILAWSTATFWFPLMIAIGVWRHVIRRVALRYHPSYWSLVFPLGMYSAATFRMRAAITLDAFAWLPKAAFALALLAWTVAFLGLIGHGLRGLTSTRAAVGDRS